MKLWAEQFKPISDKGWDLREGQEKLGNAIITTIEQGGILIGQASTGTGKSLATAIPIITKIHEAKAQKRSYRGVISTETITLQTQLAEKDLPFLLDTYGNFTFAKLLGRSNYLCINQAKENAIGNAQVEMMVRTLEKYAPNFKSGEYADVCKGTGKYIDKDMWSKLAGSSEYCSANKCSDEQCYSTIARKKALGADIVVVNHALLGMDYEMKSGGFAGTESEGLLGAYNALIVDEAHKLEEVLSSQWTEKMTEWEINDHTTRLVTGLQTGNSFYRDPAVLADVEVFMSELLKFFGTTMKFFSAIEEKYDREWAGSETALCLQYLTNPSQKILDLMNEFETVGPSLMELAPDLMVKSEKFLLNAIEEMVEQKVNKKLIKEVRKAMTSTKYLKNLCNILGKAINSKDGIISHGGTTYGVVCEGWVRKTGEKSMTIRCFPIDISEKLKGMWKTIPATALLSATLTDLTEGNFRYFKTSLGIDQCREVDVRSPFAMMDQQLVYVSAQQYEAEESTVFAVEELVDLVNTAGGRSLLLFTSRKDIMMAQQALNGYKIAGRFNYTMYVQEPDSDKAKLVEDFKRDTHSVLLGLKSMFTGIDIPGESLSLVVICRFPMPRFSTECRMRVKYWRMRKFPEWYTREALTVFQQAAGRLIRTESCVGVVALIDQRAYEAGTNVNKAATTGIASLGSRVTHIMSEVGTHLRSGV